MDMTNERLTIGQMKREFPGLTLHEMRLFCAMNNECDTKGRIFRVLPKIFLELKNEKRNAATDILEYSMKRTFLRFMTRSLNERNKMIIEFYSNLKKKIIEKSNDAGLSDSVKEHILCAVDAVWRNIHIRLCNENHKHTFYETELEKFSCQFTR